MQSTSVKVQWQRLLLLVPRLVILLLLSQFLMDWLISAMPSHARLMKDGIGFITVILVILFVAVPCLAACGVKIARDSKQDDVMNIYPADMLFLFTGLMIALNELRYLLEIDKIPLYNRLYNILIGVVGACSYGAYLYMKRRRDRRRMTETS